MIVVNNNEIKKNTDKKTVVALGSFDALHIGHTKLIKTAVSIAKEKNCVSLVQLFRIPPGVYNEKGEAECVNTLEKRLSLLENMGVDMVVIEDFDEKFRKTRYREFISQYIIGKYNAEAVCAGYNYKFGFKAEGNTDKLKEECEKYGIGVYIQECVKLDKTVSSTEIRKMVQNGDVEKAKNYLGRCYSLCGKVIKGRQLGRTMGFPTANINLPQGIVLPREGVYKTVIDIEGVQYTGITNVGHKPTVNAAEINCETHIIGFNGDLYGRDIEIGFLKRLRDIINFDTLDGLQKQLNRDVERALK